MTNKSHADTEAMRLELQEAIITFRQQITLLVQISGFLIGADALLVGYGFAQRVSSILFLAALMPVILAYLTIQFVGSALPIVYVAVTLEQELGLRRAPLATLFAARWLLGLKGNQVDLTGDRVIASISSLSRNAMIRSTPGYIIYPVIALQLALAISTAFLYRFV